MIGRLLGTLLLAVAATAFTLGAAELLARWLAPDWVPESAERGFWQYDAQLGWSHVPGRSGVHRHQDFEVDIDINAAGLRDRSYPLARGPGLQRMLVLGDSFAWGQGVERTEIWHEVVEARRPSWEIINAAVAGYGTSQQLLYYEARGREWRPDVVVLLLHPNDFLDNNEAFRYGYFKPLHVLGEAGELTLTQVPVPRLSLEQRFDRFLRFHTYFLYRLYHLDELLEAWNESRRKPEPPVEAPPPAAAAPEPAAARKRPATSSKYDVDLALTVRLLEELDAAVRASGARFLLVSTPMPDPPRRRFAEQIAATGIPYLALDAAFEGHRERIRYRHDPHWTPYGQRVAADAIEAFLVEEGVLEAR